MPPIPAMTADESAPGGMHSAFVNAGLQRDTSVPCRENVTAGTDDASAICAAAAIPLEIPSDDAPGIRAGVRRRYSARLGVRKMVESEDPNLLHVEPVLLELQGYDRQHNACVYGAADYNGDIYRVGDHVALLHEDDGTSVQWIVVVEGFYATSDNVPMFHGRWYWNIDDVRAHNSLVRLPSRSQISSYERFSTDARDKNRVESIVGRVTVLSRRCFQGLFRKHPELCEGLYYCQRKYCSEDLKFLNLTIDDFPGDEIPESIRRACLETLEPSILTVPAQKIPRERRRADDRRKLSKSKRKPKRRRVEQREYNVERPVDASARLVPNVETLEPASVPEPIQLDEKAALDDGEVTPCCEPANSPFSDRLEPYSDHEEDDPRNRKQSSLIFSGDFIF